MKTLYKVEMGVWGADGNMNLYFEDKRSATDFASEHDYCDPVEKVKIENEYVDELLEGTHYELAYWGL